MNLSELVLRKQELLDHGVQLKDEYEKAHAEITKELVRIRESMSMVNTGLDLDKIKNAESLIYVIGDASKVASDHLFGRANGNVRVEAIKDSMLAIAKNGLKKRYIGVKNYAHFGDQRSDCEYGMGPRHGSVVFHIGRHVKDRDLTEDELNNCIYYLINIKQIQESKKISKAS